MFGEFLSIVFKSIKLDKSLYSDNKNFGEASVYFAGLIMILDGIAGAVAANTIVKTAIGLSGLTAIFTWLVWALLIFVIAPPAALRRAAGAAKSQSLGELSPGKLRHI